MSSENVALNEENVAVEAPVDVPVEAPVDVPVEAPVDAPTEKTETNPEQPNEMVDQANHQEVLVNMPINNQNDALNCLIGYIGLAQRRGVFAIDESAKLFQCIQKFRGQ